MQVLNDLDRYQAYYTEKLWNLLPAIYRQEDTDSLETAGPLRELVVRIGVHAAILRRSIDRLWEDQSIESCDDWLIPYIADLLKTQLVPCLDARGQRLDVAKTIYYRRRKGTVGLIEELSSDITGWEIRVVEFFRRLSRTRHQLDPAIGPPGTQNDRLRAAEGLTGILSNTDIGGWADLRSVPGASKVGTAYDEYFYTADSRRGHGRTGWYNIPHLGIFAWRLYSFGVNMTTPVEFKDCPGCFTFDPTGREIPLFAAASRRADGVFGDQWVSPEEWRLPTPISAELLDEARDDKGKMRLWAAGPIELQALGLFVPESPENKVVAGDHIYVDPDHAASDNNGILVYPELGRFKPTDPSKYPALLSTYHYGFASTIGAGPYDRRQLGGDSIPTAGLEGGGSVLLTALSQPDVQEVVLGDSLTYDAVADVSGIAKLEIRAANLQRPVIRPADGTAWTFTGASTDSTLLLDGLFFAGAKIVLKGQFRNVTIRCCTIDPGDWISGQGFGTAADGRSLKPAEIEIHGRVATLEFDRAICGPIGLTAAASVEIVKAADSIFQNPDDNGAALSITTGRVELERSTILGQIAVNRLKASNCILGGLATVADAQSGCVRFCSYADGSAIPSPYESVATAPNAALFNSRTFGAPAYCQLREGVDSEILYGAKNRTISEGADDGSEMGAFNREKSSIKERSLLLKYEEYLPLGLAPTIIYAT